MRLKCFLAATFLLAFASARAESFAIERGDSRPFCIHSGPDETEAEHVFPIKPEKWTIWLKSYKKESNE